LGNVKHPSPTELLQLSEGLAHGAPEGAAHSESQSASPSRQPLLGAKSQPQHGHLGGFAAEKLFEPTETYRKTWKNTGVNGERKKTTLAKHI